MRINVLGVGFDNVTKSEAVDRAMDLLRSGGTHRVVTPNPEIVEVCRQRPDVAAAVNGADLVLPDGVGIIKGAAILGTPLKERTPGIEFAEGLMERLARENFSLYLLGARPGVAELAAEALTKRFPGLRIVGFHDGYFQDDAQVLVDIRRCRADVVFVCMGAPRQELWMAQNAQATGARLLCGLGGCLDIFAGVAKRAPAFWCRHGLEWFYRLCREPWRLKRMMKLPVFLIHVLGERGRTKRPKRREEPMAGYQNKDTTNWNAEEVRRAQERVERMRRSRKKRRWYYVPLYFLLVIAVSFILAECGWMLFSDFCAFNRGEVVETTVVVDTGDKVKDVADKLYDAGLIKYKLFFRAFAAVAKAEEKIGAGTYRLNTDMDYRALIVGMRSSSGTMKTETVKVTIPEGFSVRDIIALLAQKGVATEADLLDAAQNAVFDYDFIDQTSHDASRLEGYLFPDTYEFYKPERASSALNRLLINFESKLDAWEGELSYAQTRGYSLKDIVTIASLIEKETDGTDQARIASVIYHRLDGSGSRGGTYGMLQIDASLLYALPDHTGPITSADLETDSPYNLYRHEGLPPTPIANPGAKCIVAALTPESTDYYYYGLAKDGRHRFFTTYSEFTAFLASPDYIGN